MFKRKKRYNQEIGLYGEDLAAIFLIKKGYEIVGRNIKVSYREIDLIAELADITIFVEVKTRTNNIYGSAIDSLSSKKIKLLKKAITTYACENRIPLSNIRLDFIAIDIKRSENKISFEHYRNII